MARKVGGPTGSVGHWVRMLLQQTIHVSAQLMLHTHIPDCLGRPLNLEVLVPKSRSTCSLDRANRFDVGGSGNCVACRIAVHYKEGVLELDDQI